MLIVGNDCTQMRGDSDSLTISMTNDATPPVPILFVAGDTVTMTIKTEIDGDLILQKIVTVFDAGKAIMDFEPDDTATLEAREYVYDVQYESATGRVKTIVYPAKYTLLGDVT